MKDRNAELARRWFEEVWNERRAATIDELAPPDLIGHHEMTTTRSRDDFKRFQTDILGLIPDVRVAVEDVISSETDAVVRWRFYGNLAGAGTPIEFAGTSWLKISGGQIVEGWDSWNPGPLLAAQATSASPAA